MNLMQKRKLYFLMKTEPRKEQQICMFILKILIFGL